MHSHSLLKWKPLTCSARALDAMAPRCKSLQDADKCKDLVKLHLEDPHQCTLKWLGAEVVDVVNHYAKFLCAVAAAGCSIHVGVLTKCLHDEFESNGTECKAFAEKLSEALSYCRAKAHPCRRSSGSRTDLAVLDVMNAVKSCTAQVADEVPSSGEDSIVSVAPATPPRKNADDGDAFRSLKMLQEAFGEVSGTACSSSATFVPDSPMSVVSSVAASPAHATAPRLPDSQLLVPGFTDFGSPSFIYIYIYIYILDTYIYIVVV